MPDAPAELPARVRLTAFHRALFLVSEVVLIGLILALAFAPTTPELSPPNSRSGRRRTSSKRGRTPISTRDELVVGRWRAAASEAGVELTAESTTTTVVDDPVLIEIMVANSVRTPSRTTHRNGRVRVRTGDGAVRIGNTVLELSAERLAEPAEPLRRGGRDRTGSGAVARLRLAIVDTIVAAHGGSLRLQPRESGGIVATAALPLMSVLLASSSWTTTGFDASRSRRLRSSP